MRFEANLVAALLLGVVALTVIQAVANLLDQYGPTLLCLAVVLIVGRFALRAGRWP